MSSGLWPDDVDWDEVSPLVSRYWATGPFAFSAVIEILNLNLSHPSTQKSMCQQWPHTGRTHKQAYRSSAGKMSKHRERHSSFALHLHGHYLWLLVVIGSPHCAFWLLVYHALSGMVCQLSYSDLCQGTTLHRRCWSIISIIICTCRFGSYVVS